MKNNWSSYGWSTDRSEEDQPVNWSILRRIQLFFLFLGKQRKSKEIKAKFSSRRISTDLINEIQLIFLKTINGSSREDQVIFWRRSSELLEKIKWSSSEGQVIFWKRSRDLLEIKRSSGEYQGYPLENIKWSYGEDQVILWGRPSDLLEKIKWSSGEDIVSF